MRKLTLGLVVALAVLALSVNAYAKTITVPDDYATIQAAVDAAETGDKIIVEAGDYYGARVNKTVEIKGEDGARIVDGPIVSAAYGYKAGFALRYAADGTTISHFTIPCDGLFMIGVTVSGADDVTISHLNISNAVDGVLMWHCNRATVTHNVIALNRTVRTNVGIFSGVIHSDRTADNNLIAFNKISVVPYTWGAKRAFGIVLSRGPRAGGSPSVQKNKVVHNKVLVADRYNDTAFRLADALGYFDAVTDNRIGFNDFRGSTIEIEEIPDGLFDENKLSRNLGENRGHGETPADIYNPQPPDEE